MAWAAVRNEVEWPAVGVFTATICWAIGYDTIYALQDRDDDSRVGIHSSALYFGKRVWLAVLLILIVMVGILAVVGAALNLGAPFYIALFAATLWFVYQANRIRQGVSRSEAFTLFKQHVWIGALILCGMWASLLIA